MADVVFAGTSQRKPMGMAEVKLVLEMADPALPGATREVVVSRRLYRDTGSEYRINGKECRLKDIQDLLLDTGMGTRAYSFIQQGQIDLILSTKPKDRRGLIEEAAGITRYKLRRVEAERRLEDTKANLLRLDDILHELGKQRESLQRQAARARRAQELDASIRSTQRILLAGKLGELEAAKERLVEQLDGLERQIATLTAQASEKATEVSALRQELDERHAAQERRGRAILGLEQRLGLAEQDRGFQESRIRESKEAQARLEARLEELSTRSGDSEVELGRLQEALKAAEAALEGREGLVTEAESAVALAGGALRKVEGELRELRERRLEAQKAALAAQRQRQALHQQIAQLEGRLEALNHEESLRAPRLEGLQADGQRLSRELEAAETRLEQVEEAVQVQSRLGQEASGAFRASAEALREAEGALDGEERRLRQLTDLARQSAGDAALQEGLAWLRSQGEAPAGLAELLQVDEAVRPDLERLLGAWLQTVGAGEGVLARAAEAPGQLWLWAGAAAEPCAAPQGCEALAPQASPLKLRAELEACRRQREALLERVEELEERRRKLQLQHQEAQERGREMEEDLTLARRNLEDLKGRNASVQAQLREIREAQARADEQWERPEQEIAGLKVQLRGLEAQPEQAEEEGLEEAIHGAEVRHLEAQQELESQRERLVEASRMRSSSWAERDSLQRQVLQI